MNYWSKSYGNFAKWVNFAFWWSFNSEGSASAACAAGLFITARAIFNRLGVAPP